MKYVLLWEASSLGPQSFSWLPVAAAIGGAKRMNSHIVKLYVTFQTGWGNWLKIDILVLKSFHKQLRRQGGILTILSYRVEEILK